TELFPARPRSDSHQNLALPRPPPGDPLGKEGDRFPDRRALRGDLVDRRAYHAADDVRGAARLGRPGSVLHRGGPGAPVAVPMRLTPSIAAPRERPGTLEVYRDDGPLARALGSVFGRAIPLPPVVLLLAGALPFVAVLAIAGDGASRLTVALVLAWLVLCAGISCGRPHSDPLRWTAPPLLRLVEYGGVIWFAALAGSSSLPASFALLAAVAFRHYDLVYRLRYHGVTPP